MAYLETQLSKIGELKPAPSAGVGRQRWHYEAGADDVATVIAAGYFNAARGLLNVGDRIDLVAATGSAIRFLSVTDVPKESGNVTVEELATA